MKELVIKIEVDGNNVRISNNDNNCACEYMIFKLSDVNVCIENYIEMYLDEE